MEIYFLMVLYKYFLKLMFVKLQDLEKYTESRILLGSPTDLENNEQ